MYAYGRAIEMEPFLDYAIARVIFQRPLKRLRLDMDSAVCVGVRQHRRGIAESISSLYRIPWPRIVVRALSCASQGKVFRAAVIALLNLAPVVIVVYEISRGS